MVEPKLIAICVLASVLICSVCWLAWCFFTGGRPYLPERKQ